MKLVQDLIHRCPVWVNPEHTAESAVVLMRGHNIGALPVLDGPKLVGMVICNHLLGVDPRQRVGDLMMVGVPTISPRMSVREAAAQMARANLGRVPVVECGRLVGVLTVGDLLPELGRVADPLTGLPWTDTLREWATARLEQGLEITLLFIDLDGFGQFNKTYGHIVGDEVLRSVAEVIAQAVDHDQDVACRYGGDEFCVATLRSSSAATDLAARIARMVRDVSLPSLGGQIVTCTIGQSGGKRTRERDHVHYAATLNNLINLASRDCTARKSAHAQAVIADIPVVGQGGSPRLRLGEVELRWEGAVAHTCVNLHWAGTPGRPLGGQEPLMIEGLTHYSASASARTDSEGALRLVAETAVAALRNVLPDGYDLQLTDMLLTRTAAGQGLITVVASWITPSGQSRLAGTSVIAGSSHRSAASAVLATVNRSLSGVLIAAR
ncbi:MAG TPA: GGDEF domain-containing protein [Chthonomonadales bacterium]|nr:GGDEF domain-containing protein [Chthonomonadales bacterium]